MKVLIAEGPKKVSFCELPRPIPAADEVLIRIRFAGICGTDYAIYSGSSSFIEDGRITYPVRFGHEWSGTVEEIGSGVTRFRKGDRVIGDNAVACGKCEACRRGDYDHCREKKCVGTINCWDGCFAEYMVMPERHVYRLDDRVSLLESTLAEPLSVAYGGIRRMRLTPDSVVAVIGTGCIGMSAVALAKHYGAGKVLMIGRNPYKLEIARQVGADVTIDSREMDAGRIVAELCRGRGADYVIECAGAEDTLELAIELAAPEAMIAVIGFYERRLDGVNMDLFVSKQLQMFGVMGEFGNIEAVSKIMSEGTMRLAPIITARISFEECMDPFVHEAQYHATSIKTILEIGEGTSGS